MIRRTYLGLDIRPSELRAVALHRHGREHRLAAGRLLPLAEGILQTGLRNANIRDGKRFVAALQEVLQPLASREERIAVALPEGAGRLLLHESEENFRSREEGAEILCWQLKNLLPDEPREVHIDFQLLGRASNGHNRLLVALIARRVLGDYEERIAEAGYGAQAIDFFPCNLYNFYRQRRELGTDFILVGVDRQTLSLQIFQESAPVFFRACNIEESSGLVFQELSRSVAGQNQKLPNLERCPVFLHCDWPETAAIEAAVNAVFGRTPILLESPLQSISRVPLDLPAWRLRGLAAAVGAAERLF